MGVMDDKTKQSEKEFGYSKVEHDEVVGSV